MIGERVDLVAVCEMQRISNAMNRERDKLGKIVRIQN
jgi:hypothetical protein